MGKASGHFCCYREQETQTHDGKALHVYGNAEFSALELLAIWRHEPATTAAHRKGCSLRINKNFIYAVLTLPRDWYGMA
jgi:hypothetical protein